MRRSHELMKLFQGKKEKKKKDILAQSGVTRRAYPCLNIAVGAEFILVPSDTLSSPLVPYEEET